MQRRKMGQHPLDVPLSNEPDATDGGTPA